MNTVTVLNSRDEETQQPSPDDESKIALPTGTLITEQGEMKRLGIIKVKIPSYIDCEKWATEYSKLTPMILSAQGDDEAPFYRNILDEPDFSFGNLLKDPAIAKAFEENFDDPDLFQMDDAFCVHYNEKQFTTAGAKHTDPSDVTINLCLQKEKGTQGSHVAFHGALPLKIDTGESSSVSVPRTAPPEIFNVVQEPGYATLHWGKHPHETLPLESGSRTNIILTYCYKDPSKSDVANRTCYA